MPKVKKGLGKGLSALIPDLVAEGEERHEIGLDLIVPNPYQPRRNFSAEGLQELADSIRQYGVVQPIVLRRTGETYQIVAGERRWRAARLAGLGSIPAVVRDYSDREAMEIALVENLQRADLSPIEEALAYRRLVDEFKLTQDEVAERVGRSRPHVANILRLLNLPPEIQEYVSRGTLTMGHARALLAIDDAARQVALAQRTVAQNLTVRDVEQLCRGVPSPAGERRDRKSRPPKEEHDPLLSDIEDQLKQAFGTKVQLLGSASRGKIEVEYYSQEELERIVDLLLHPEAETRARVAAGRGFHI